jgi:pimeloyl-ACP methyl ester carboxylesterase
MFQPRLVPLTSGPATIASRKEVHVRGRTVSYHVAGAGEPVVLIHGLSGSMNWWRPTIPALGARYRVYLVDLPGFGGMRRWGRDFVLTETASWVADWMNAIGESQAHIVGHSMGGFIALRLAATRSQMVKRLVLIAPAGVPGGRSLLGYAWPLLQAIPRMAPRFLPRLALDTLRSGPFTVLRAARDLLRQDIVRDAGSVHAPTLILCGEHDTLIPPSACHILRATLPNARLLILEGANHVPMYERGDALDKAILAFLSGRPVGE